MLDFNSIFENARKREAEKLVEVNALSKEFYPTLKGACEAIKTFELIDSSTITLHPSSDSFKAGRVHFRSRKFTVALSITADHESDKCFKVLKEYFYLNGNLSNAFAYRFDSIEEAVEYFIKVILDNKY